MERDSHFFNETTLAVFSKKTLILVFWCFNQSKRRSSVNFFSDVC